MKNLRIAVILLCVLAGGCFESATNKNPIANNLVTFNSKLGVQWKNAFGDGLESQMAYNLFVLNKVSNAQHQKMVNFAERIRTLEELAMMDGDKVSIGELAILEDISDPNN